MKQQAFEEVKERAEDSREVGNFSQRVLLCSPTSKFSFLSWLYDGQRSAGESK